MVYARVVESDNGYILENKNFNILIKENGSIGRWVTKEHDKNLVAGEDNFIDRIENPQNTIYLRDSGFYAAAKMTSLMFQVDGDFFNFRKVYSITDYALIVDIYIQVKSKLDFLYSSGLKFRDVDFFMINDERFDSNVKKQSDNLLVADKKSDIYLGCIFKTAKLDIDLTKRSMDIGFYYKLSPFTNSLFHSSFKFSLV